jgi:uncharacterized membrane protein
MVAHKTRVFAALVIFTNVVGNLLLTMGLRQVGSLVGSPPMAYIQALFHPLVAAGVSLLVVWMIAQMTLLSWADLSYVLPVTSIGYVLAAVAGRVFLHEQVTLNRWGGVGLIVLGVVLVSRTPVATRQAPVATRKREVA